MLAIRKYRQDGIYKLVAEYIDEKTVLKKQVYETTYKTL